MIVLGTFHTTWSWRDIYIMWLLEKGLDMNQDENIPAARKIIEIFDKLPKTNPLHDVKKELAKHSLNGKKVMIEFPFDLYTARKVITQAQPTEDVSDYKFIVGIADYVLNQGGIPQVIGRKDLQSTSKNWRDALRQTIHMVEQSPMNAGFLVTGLAHADHIQAILGKKAQVIRVAPPALLKVATLGKRNIRKRIANAKPITRERLQRRVGRVKMRK